MFDSQTTLIKVCYIRSPESYVTSLRIALTTKQSKHSKFYLIYILNRALHFRYSISNNSCGTIVRFYASCILSLRTLWEENSFEEEAERDLVPTIRMAFHQPNTYSIALETRFEFFCGVLIPSWTTC